MCIKVKIKDKRYTELKMINRLFSFSLILGNSNMRDHLDVYIIGLTRYVEDLDAVVFLDYDSHPPLYNMTKCAILLVHLYSFHLWL